MGCQPDGSGGLRDDMLIPEDVDRIIRLHEKSYRFLKWINSSVSHNTLKFNVIHRAMNTSEASLEWIKRHFHEIPADICPPEESLNEFACLFASYLMTSFKLSKKPVMILRSSHKCGRNCYCMMCSYLAAAGHLVPRKPSKKASKQAVDLKHICLSSLAEELELALLDSELEQLMKDRSLKEAVSLLTYYNEVIRRSRFVSQGEAVLVLWREIAWQGTVPKKGFRLKSEAVLSAEKSIIEKMYMF